MRATSAPIAVAAAIALAAAGHAAAKDWPSDPPRINIIDSQAQRDWAKRYLDQDDWTLAGFVNDQFWLVSSEVSAHSDYPIVRDWFRVETGRDLDASLPIASSLVLAEADCSKTAYRAIRFVNYRGNNLHGAILADVEPPNPKMESWSAGSIGESVARLICQGVEPPEASK